MDHHPDCPEASSALTVEKHYPKYCDFMEAVCLEPEGNLATTNASNNRDSNNSHHAQQQQLCSIKSKDVSTHAHCKLSEHKYHRAGSCGPVCLKYWTSPNSQSNLFAGEVSGGENYSNLFYTRPATYLTLILLWQPICKSYSRCSSLLSLTVPQILYIHTRSGDDQCLVTSV